MNARKTVLYAALWSAALWSAAFLAVSCSGPRSINGLSLPDTPVLAADGRYAVIVEPYVSMRDKPGDSGITIAHARKGDIFSIQGKRIVESGDTRVLWIDLEKGWVAESCVHLYSGEERAKTAARLLK